MAKKKDEQTTDKPPFEDMFIDDSEEQVAEDNTEQPIEDPEDDFDQLTQTEAFSRSELEEIHQKEKEAQLQETEDAKAKDKKSAKKTDGRKVKNIRGIPKLVDANKAGTKESIKCTLILTEGDSAKTMAISGLPNRDYYGVFPLRGKLLNVKDTAFEKIVNNDYDRSRC